MISVYGSQGKSQAQPDGGEGHSVITTGSRWRCLGRQWLCYGRVTQKHGVTNRNRVRRTLAGPVCNTRLSPLSIKAFERTLGAYVLKDVCLPREASHVPRKVACDRNWLKAGQPALTAWEKSAEGIVAVGETSRGNHGGLTPAKARTVPGLNSTGKWLWLLRMNSYLHIAAEAEMPIACEFWKPGKIRGITHIWFCLYQPNRRGTDRYARWCGRAPQWWGVLSRWNL